MILYVVGCPKKTLPCESTAGPYVRNGKKNCCHHLIVVDMSMMFHYRLYHMIYTYPWYPGQIYLPTVTIKMFLWIQASKMIEPSISPSKASPTCQNPRDSSLFFGLEIHRHAAAPHKSSWSMVVSKCATGTNISITFANSWRKKTTQDPWSGNVGSD